MVQAVALADAEHPLPRLLVHGRIAREGEVAVLHRAAQQRLSAVDVEVVFAHLELPHAERGDVLVHLHQTAEVRLANVRLQEIDVGVELVPQQGALADEQRVDDGMRAGCEGVVLRLVDMMRAAGGALALRHIVDGALHGLACAVHHDRPNHRRIIVDVGIDLQVVNIDTPRPPQLQRADDAIPVALRLVGDAMAVGAWVDVLHAVVDADGNEVLSFLNIGRDVELVRHAQAILHAHLLAVYPDGTLPMGPLEVERHVLPRPLLRQVHFTDIPRRTHIVLVGGEEEGELDVSLHTVLLHRGVVVVGAVVERACPHGIYRDVVALQHLGHGARQGHGVVQRRPTIPLLRLAHVLAVHLELPRAAKVNHRLRLPR